jgi:hypothetical protein
MGWKTQMSAPSTVINVPEVKLFTFVELPYPGLFSEEWDTDMDGIPDNWELAYFNDIGSIDHFTTDTNNNGLINAVEYVLGLDPLNPNSTFEHNLNITPNKATFSFSTQPFREYTIFNVIKTGDDIEENIIASINGSEINEDNPNNEFSFDINNSASYEINVRIRLSPYIMNLDADEQETSPGPALIPPPLSQGRTIYTTYEP